MSDNPGAPPPPVPGATPSAQDVVDFITTKQPGEGDRVPRDEPQPDEARKRLVKQWCARVRADKKHFERPFKRMRANMAFTSGDQWPQDIMAEHGFGETRGRRQNYVANICIRHVQQRTAALYASNPDIVAKKRDRLLASTWDGDMVTLQAAQQQMAMLTQQSAMLVQAGQMPPPMPGQPPPGAQNAAAILADFKMVQSYDKMLDRVCKTLEILYKYNVDEQTFSFKQMMKMTVRRAIITGIGYVKIGFQRALAMSPEIETRIADMTERLATVERIANDISDDQIRDEAAEVEQMRLSIQALQQEAQIIVREGLLFDYPDSTAIIPDLKCKSLRGFLGADWVTQEYVLAPDEIQEIYGIDVRSAFRSYSINDRTGAAEADSENPSRDHDRDDSEERRSRAVVWEIYSRKDGLVYTVADGFPDFLEEPTAPDVYLDRFYPWFGLVMNEGYAEHEIYPQSDIDLMRDMQSELNRARQGLREHRKANRPKMAVAGGIMEEADKTKLQNHPPNAVLELNMLAPGQKIEDVLQPVKMPPIDSALYDTTPTFEDILRVLGQDQAANGQTTSATATEAAVAQASQHTDLASVIDDQDELLSEIAMAAGKILLMNVSSQTVQKVVGPGAVWPELTKEDIIDSIYLTIRAGSTGRPNQQKEVQNVQILFPLLQRVPGINPEWMARELVKRLDDRLDLTEAFMAGMPSMDAINRIQGTVQAPPPQDPQNPITSGQMPPALGPNGQPMPPAPPPMPGQPMTSPFGGAVPPGPPGGPGQRRPGTPTRPGTSSPRPAAPVAPPTAGPNDPTAQGPAGAQNAPAINPVNGLLGPRTPPVPGANGLMPGRGGGPRIRPGDGRPTP